MNPKIAFHISLPSNVYQFGSMTLASNGDLYTVIMTRDFGGVPSYSILRIPNYGRGTPVPVAQNSMMNLVLTYDSTGYPPGLAFSSGANLLYVVSVLGAVVLTADGSFLRSIPITAELYSSMAADSQGNLYIANFGVVDKYDSFGNRLDTLTPPRTFFSHDTTVALDSSDRVYIADETTTIYVFAPDGTVLPSISPQGEKGQTGPYSIRLLKINKAGHLYGSYTGNSTIYEWDSSGTLLAVTDKAYPSAIDDQNRIYTNNGDVYQPF